MNQRKKCWNKLIPVIKALTFVCLILAKLKPFIEKTKTAFSIVLIYFELILYWFSIQSLSISQFQ